MASSGNNGNNEDREHRGSTDILIDIIRQITEALRDLVLEIRELRRDLQEQAIGELKEIRAEIDGRRNNRSELIKHAEKWFRSPPIQLLATVVIFWLAARLGVLQEILRVVNPTGTP